MSLFAKPTIHAALESITKSLGALDQAIDFHEEEAVKHDERATALREQAEAEEQAVARNTECGRRAARIKLRLIDLLA